MDMHLVVVRPFDGLARGEAVLDRARITDILSSEHAADVVRVNTRPTEPAVVMPTTES
jgi:hypothetical protein